MVSLILTWFQNVFVVQHLYCVFLIYVIPYAFSPAFENGSIPTLLQNTPNNKRNSSVRSSSLSQYRDAHNGGSPAPDRLSSVCSLHNDTEDNFKTNNLDEDIAEKDEEAMSMDCELPTKVFQIFKFFFNF